MTDPDALNRALEIAAKHAMAHLNGDASRSVGTTVPREELRERLSRPLSASGTDPRTVIEDLARDVEGGILRSTSGRFFGWVIGGTLPVALAADWLTSAWDQNAAIHATAPALAVIEDVAGEWLKTLFGLPQTASFAFVSGTQMAHVTCLAAARHRLLKRQGWDVEEAGLVGAPAIRIITSKEACAALVMAHALGWLSWN